MATTDLRATVQALVAEGKGILAADETVPTVTKRLEAAAVASTAINRRAYRELFFTTPGIAQYISGVILHDETIRQTSSTGRLFADVLAQQGILPGIKVDAGTQPLAGSPGEAITEGLDGLRGRLETYRGLGARFAKWRAVFAVTDTHPSVACIQANAHALARYATLCQEQGLVPIVEPEVLMDGDHTIERCEQVTGAVLHAVFDALEDQHTSLEGMLLKPNMVIPGSDCARQATVQEVAVATLRCLLRHAPAAVPGVVFLSGGQDHLAATEHLSAINQIDRPKPWKLSFSYGRALQDEALKAWHGRSEHLRAAQQAFHHRAKCDSAAALGRYTTSMENESAVA
jgi:fructose-bisphosphate aldolase class I